MDFAAISTAIAGRYLAAQMTAPTGYRPIRVATDQLPNQLPPLPCVLIFPEDGDFDAGNGTRMGLHRFTARFYYDQSGDLPRAQAACLAWLTVLADQHKAGVQLGGLVTFVRTVTWKIGTMTYAGKDYYGIELGLSVRTSEAWQATA